MKSLKLYKIHIAKAFNVNFCKNVFIDWKISFIEFFLKLMYCTQFNASYSRVYVHFTPFMKIWKITGANNNNFQKNA